MKAIITDMPHKTEIYPDKIVILGTEIEADFCEADLYDRFENIRQALAKYKPQEKENMAAAIREQCEMVFECFDELFGDGTAERIFGSRTNLRLCLQAFAELSEQANGQLAALRESYKPYAGNRAQKRLLNNG